LSDLKGFKDSERVKRLIGRIREIYPGGELKFMEVCGTHTMAIARFGLRRLMPEGLVLLSGPGCPVCVTPTAVIDAALKISENSDTVIVTFGDMMSVPGSEKSLELRRAEGADVRVLYSVYDMLEMAAHEPQKSFVFISVGFETTTPGIALSVLETRKRRLKNVSFLVANRLVIPAMDALLSAGEVHIDGFLCPGHVSVIIGWEAYRPIARQYKVPCVVAGFEPVDILLAIHDILSRIVEGVNGVGNSYPRAVKESGNPEAMRIMKKVFRVAEAEWRGIGLIPESGLALRDEYADLDAVKRFGVELLPVPDPPGCRCGDVLKGVIIPPQCRLFGKRCTPETPVGPCMVSSEGSCAAYYKYGDMDEKR
jgi:hydrogenase expression/formation protein HypD